VRAAEAEAEALHAEEIVQEQGEVHEGAQDVSMAEIEAGEEAEVSTTTNGVRHRDRDDDRNTPPPVNGDENGVEARDADADDDEDAMRDD
jgi:hypothetical protein